MSDNNEQNNTLEVNGINGKVVRSSQLDRHRRALIEIFITRKMDGIEVAIDPLVFEHPTMITSLMDTIDDIKGILASQLEAAKAGKNDDMQKQLLELEKEQVKN